MMASSCSIPVIGDLFESESSLGKTNNTAVTIAAAMKDYLKNKKKTDLALYGLEMILNSDGNGTVKLYYTAALPDKAAYSDIYVSELIPKPAMLNGLAGKLCQRRDHAVSNGAGMPGNRCGLFTGGQRKSHFQRG